MGSGVESLRIGVRGGGRYPKVLLRVPWLSRKKGKVSMKEKEKEKERIFFLIVRSLKMLSNVSIRLRVSLRGAKMITSSPHPWCLFVPGVNFRPAGGVRGQVAGSLPGRQPGTGTRQGRGGAVTPSFHLEVPGVQLVSPGYGLDIRQSMS